MPFSRFKSCPLVLLLGIIWLSTGCSAGRTPIPAGEIPRAARLSPEDEKYGEQVYSSLRRQYRPLQQAPEVRRVRQLVDDITRAGGAGDSPWRVYVFDDDSVVNAAATRGNYVFVWTGMLKTVSNDSELATVVSHEIGHVLAGHTSSTPGEEANDIMSQASGRVIQEILARQGSISPIAGVAGSVASEILKALIVNPESQRKELEADQIGLFLMADAGFDPTSATSFWRKASADPRMGGVPLEFLSTHPSSEKRLEQLNRLLPSALARYRNRDSRSGPGADEFLAEPRPERPSEFALHEKSSRRFPGLPGPWVSLFDNVPVYAEANRGSGKVGTLKAGEQLRVVDEYGEWIEIAEPVFGYVPRDGVAPAYDSPSK